ncbi:hypothetical protein [Siphonobacter sp. SORGH_AS_1065]|uniref:hypothetical protein n=1 Tax=Siphonobacter sp. SORGH_AS_1065 TaxID=3041795 RepID=UPI0027803746|nr:hypothetical protein [Siphonobacter sp. SORGH_AS_1065]MDQ1088827.1 hypothetical protein [Siphonobacter sp. SORGH_AS_1065]
MSNNRSISLLVFGMGLVPILLYFYLLDSLAINIPKWDDHGLRAFIMRFQEAQSLPQYIDAFWRQHNEHRIVYDRIVSLLDYVLTGHLNFVHLMWVGNLSLLFIVLVWYKVLKQSVGLLYVLPIPFLIFNLSQWENMYWGMAALQNFGVIAWVICCLYALAYQLPLGICISLAILTSITSTNGLLIWPLGVIMLWLQSPKKKVFIWLGVGVLVWVLYFLHYEKTEQPTHPVPNKIVAYVRAVLLILGSIAEPLYPRKSTLLVLGTGLILFVLSGGILLRLALKVFQKQSLTKVEYFLGSALAFVLGTTAIVAFGRLGFDENTFTTSRYKVYTIVISLLVYTWLILQTNGFVRKTIGLVTLLFSLLIAWTSYSYFYDDSLRLRNQLMSDQFNYSYPAEPVKSKPINKAAAAWYDASLNTLLQPDTNQLTAYPGLKITQTKQVSVLEMEKAGEAAKDFTRSYYLLHKPGKSYLVPFMFTAIDRPGVAPASRNYIHPYSSTTIDHNPNQYLPGDYSLLVVTHDHRKSTLYKTGQTIHIPDQDQTPALKQNW